MHEEIINNTNLPMYEEIKKNINLNTDYFYLEFYKVDWNTGMAFFRGGLPEEYFSFSIPYKNVDNFKTEYIASSTLIQGWFCFKEDSKGNKKLKKIHSTYFLEEMYTPIDFSGKHLCFGRIYWHLGSSKYLVEIQPSEKIELKIQDNGKPIEEGYFALVLIQKKISLVKSFISTDSQYNEKITAKCISVNTTSKYEKLIEIGERPEEYTPKAIAYEKLQKNYLEQELSSLFPKALKDICFHHNASAYECFHYKGYFSCYGTIGETIYTVKENESIVKIFYASWPRKESFYVQISKYVPQYNNNVFIYADSASFPYLGEEHDHQKALNVEYIEEFSLMDSNDFLIKQGVNPDIAHTITNQLGSDICEKIHCNIDYLIDIKNVIKEDEYEKIKNIFLKKRIHGLLRGYLKSLKFSDETIEKIFNNYNKESLNIAFKNPFILYYQDNIITFAEANKLAKFDEKNNNNKLFSKPRLAATVLYICKRNERQGNIEISGNDIQKQIPSILDYYGDLDQETVQKIHEATTELVDKRKLIKSGDTYSVFKPWKMKTNNSIRVNRREGFAGQKSTYNHAIKPKQTDYPEFSFKGIFSYYKGVLDELCTEYGMSYSDVKTIIEQDWEKAKKDKKIIIEKGKDKTFYLFQSRFTKKTTLGNSPLFVTCFEKEMNSSEQTSHYIVSAIKLKYKKIGGITRRDIKFGKNDSVREMLHILADIAKPENWGNSYEYLESYFYVIYYCLLVQNKILYGKNRDGEMIATFHTGLYDLNNNPVLAYLKKDKSDNRNRYQLMGFATYGNSATTQYNNEAYGKEISFAFPKEPMPADFTNGILPVFKRGSTIKIDYSHCLRRLSRMPMEFAESLCNGNPECMNILETIKQTKNSEDWSANSKLWEKLIETIETEEDLIIKRKFEYIITIAKTQAEHDASATPKLAVPIVYLKENSLSLAVPLRLFAFDRDKFNEPCAALIISELPDGNYQGETIFTMSMAHKNARPISKPEENWLKLTDSTAFTDNIDDDLLDDDNEDVSENEELEN